MAFQLSPGVSIREIDLTTIVPSVATTDGALAGVFRWGPIGETILVDSQDKLAQYFGKPTNLNAETFFTGSNFLNYGERLWISRAGKTSGFTPGGIEFTLTGTSNNILTTTADISQVVPGMYITQTSNTTVISGDQTGEDYEIISANSSAITLNQTITGTAGTTELSFARKDATYTAVGAEADSDAVIVANLVHQIVRNVGEFESKQGNFDSDLLYIAKYPGKMGNSLRVSVCDNANSYTQDLDLGASARIEFIVGSSEVYVVSNTASNTAANLAFTSIAVKDYLKAGTFTSREQYCLVESKSYAEDTSSNVVFGSSGSNGAVNTTNGFISLNNLANTINGDLVFQVGDIVTYANTTGDSTGGLSSGSNYYVISSNSSGLIISSTRDGVSAVTAAAGGTEHSFTADMKKVTFTIQDPFRLNENYSSNTASRFWEYFNVVDTAPGQSDYVLYNGNTSAQDEMHVVVVDEGGDFTGTPGTILEVFAAVSRATDSKNSNGTVNYYVDLINESSEYVWVVNDRTTAYSNTALNVTSSSSASSLNTRFRFGSDGLDEENATLSILGDAYDLFASAEDIDISLVMQGRPVGGSTVVNGETIVDYQLANYIIDNICDARKDCVGFVSPDKTAVINNIGREATSVKNWRGAVRNTSYAVMDSGYKYQYDRYNDVYRWVPLNGDIAGLCARTDQTNDSWWSPAGFNRGNIKNFVKLAWNPRKAERDILYPNGVNPVVSFPGQGTVLFGDKTLQAKPSAFDRINVRRLFITLEKAISKSSQYFLFEFNDAFTRAQFKNLINPYLRNIQGRRGIYDFLVVCDETNNTPFIIDSNQFVGDIYIKPARSINFIQLNFVAVGTGVQFSEVVGKF